MRRHRVEEKLERRRHAPREVDVVGGGVEATVGREAKLEVARHAGERVVGDARGGCDAEGRAIAHADRGDEVVVVGVEGLAEAADDIGEASRSELEREQPRAGDADGRAARGGATDRREGGGRHEDGRWVEGELPREARRLGEVLPVEAEEDGHVAGGQRGGAALGHLVGDARRLRLGRAGAGAEAADEQVLAVASARAVGEASARGDGASAGGVVGVVVGVGVGVDVVGRCPVCHAEAAQPQQCAAARAVAVHPVQRAVGPGRGGVEVDEYGRLVVGVAERLEPRDAAR